VQNLKIPKENRIARAENEAKILRTVGDLNFHTLPLLDLMKFPSLNSAVLVFPYVEPHSIGKRDVCKCFYQLLQAVKHCHEKGIIHMDIKPSNILYNADSGDLQLIDFGCSIWSGQPIVELGGTRIYAAPEVLWGYDESVGTASDIWSAGVVFAEWLTGKQIFKAQTNIEVISQIRNFDCQQYFKDFTLPSKALALLRLMLKDNPDHRITAEEALKHPYFSPIYPVQQSTITPKQPTSDLEENWKSNFSRIIIPAHNFR